MEKTASEKVAITDRGLLIQAPLDEREWHALGLELTRRGRGYRWQLGDWWLAHRGNDALKYAFLEALDLDLKTLQNLASVCAAFPLEERVVELSVKHHEAVMGLPRDVRARLLQEAAAMGWTVEELRDAARKAARRLPPEELPRQRGRVMNKTQVADLEFSPMEALEDGGAGSGSRPRGGQAEILPLHKLSIPSPAVVMADGCYLEHREFPEVRVVVQGGRIFLWNPSLRMTPQQARALAEVLWEAARREEQGVVAVGH